MDAHSQETDRPQRPALALPVRAALAALCGAACAALLAYDPIAFLLYPPAAGLMAALLCENGRGRPPVPALLPLAAAALAGCLSGTFGVAAVCRALLLPLTALCIWQVQARCLGGFLTAAAAGAAAVACLYGMVCLPGVLDGSGAFAGALAWATEGMTALQTALEPLRGLEQYAGTVAMCDQLLTALPQSVPVLTTGALISFGGAGALLAVVLFFAFTRRRRAALGLHAPQPFRLWNIPRAYTPGLIGLYVLALLLRLFEFANADAVYCAVSALLGVPLVTQGLAMIAFLLARRRYPSRSLNAVVFTVLALLLPVTGSMLSTLGLLEQLVRLRERPLPPVPPPYRGA